jgi:hypothetical protein
MAGFADNEQLPMNNDSFPGKPNPLFLPMKVNCTVYQKSPVQPIPPFNFAA